MQDAAQAASAGGACAARGGEELVQLSVGGRHFASTRTTLCTQRGMLAAMFEAAFYNLPGLAEAADSAQADLAAQASAATQRTAALVKAAAGEALPAVQPAGELQLREVGSLREEVDNIVYGLRGYTPEVLASRVKLLELKVELPKLKANAK
ncbi:hypothetical protein ABPG75_005048 [Micractinium tetrahymenae]